LGANGAGIYGFRWANRGGARVRVDIAASKQKEEYKETSEGW